ncbi:bile acid:sodium symporter family protein [Cytophaga sp. FL35]|uniref:bile acid:sodium symporter family protein n=1 Tax=Cytophaga sp. FL35 TaxID=1904456 RepID=UPI00165390C2|nr:bile acid:sodium symporter family protein [Cytophaga sp. FL35]MBC7000093.1 bile acid:sodium symporter [Cytophaga sp. FL35]
MRLKIDYFVTGILFVILLAYMFPHVISGSTAQLLNTISSIGISLIFFFYGLKLSPDKLKSGLGNFKLHFLIQGATFLLFPVLVLLFRPLITSAEQETIWLAFFFLAALPSTVSSSVVMVSLAKGNIPAAIFNASISGIIGILVTPLWMGFFWDNSEINFNLKEIYVNLILQVLVPVFVGMSLQRFFGAIVQRNSSKLATFDKAVILLIIYKSYVKSFNEDLFGNISWMDLALLFVGAGILFVIVYYLLQFISKYLDFSMEDCITAQFCGTKKSLVHGTVFSKILFGSMAIQGIILLPLMVFHILQMIVISAIANKYGRRNQTNAQ